MSKVNEDELKEMFVGIKDNDENVFEELYERYYSLVYSIAFSILKNKDDSEDVAQTVFTKIFKIDKEQLPKKSEASWLYQVTKNEAISYIRKKRPEISLDRVYDVQDKDDAINNIIDKGSYNELINKLNDKEKQIISLKVLAGLSFEEISKLLDEPTGTVKWRYYKSVHTLRLILSNLGMFIITFAIGITTLFKRKVGNSAQIAEDTLENEGEITEDATIEDDEQESLGIEDETELPETIMVEDVQEISINYYSVGILSVSAIFLVVTIVLLVQYRLKRQCKKFGG